MAHPRAERAEYGYQKAERLRQQLEYMRNELFQSWPLTPPGHEELQADIEREIAECEAIYKPTCPWLLQQFGDVGHDELRTKWPGIGWETRIQPVNDVVYEVRYPLPSEPVQLKAGEEVPAIVRHEYGTAEFIRYANSKYVFGIGYAPEIDTLWYWWRTR